MHFSLIPFHQTKCEIPIMHHFFQKLQPHLHSHSPSHLDLPILRFELLSLSRKGFLFFFYLYIPIKLPSLFIFPNDALIMQNLPMPPITRTNPRTHLWTDRHIYQRTTPIDSDTPHHVTFINKHTPGTSLSFEIRRRFGTDKQ